MFCCCVEILNMLNPLLVLCLNMGIEALNENIGHWETTWFNFHILHVICFNLVEYDLYHRGT